MSLMPEEKDRVPKFPMGRILVSVRAKQILSQGDVVAGLLRHASGDWGLVEDEDRKLNDRALLIGDRLFSIYRSEAGVKFYVITEWGRSVTTVLLPEDY